MISKKGTPLQTGARCVVERTNSWHTRVFRKLQICTERRTRVIDAFIAVAKRDHYHPPPHPGSLDPTPLGRPTITTTMTTYRRNH